MVVEVEAGCEPASGVVGEAVWFGDDEDALDAAVEEALGLSRFAKTVTAEQLAEETGATPVAALLSFERVVRRAAAA